MFSTRLSDHVGSNQLRDVVGTKTRSTSNPTANHEISSNTRPTNLNELLYVKYSNSANNNNITLDELRLHYCCCCNSTMDDGSDNDKLSATGEFFEGVEKLLEVWFTTQSGNTANCDLRRIPR